MQQQAPIKQTTDGGSIAGGAVVATGVAVAGAMLHWTNSRAHTLLAWFGQHVGGWEWLATEHGRAAAAALAVAMIVGVAGAVIEGSPAKRCRRAALARSRALAAEAQAVRDEQAGVTDAELIRQSSR